MDKPINKSTYKNIKRRKKQQAKRIIDKLTYNPPKIKKKLDHLLRSKLKAKARGKNANSGDRGKKIKFGSMNVHGLDFEAQEAVEEFLTKREFDVRI